MEKKEIKLDIKITDVSNKCLTHIRKTTENVALISYCIKSFNSDSFPPIEVDGLPIVLDDPNKEQVDPKEQTIQWIFKKAFEDFIIGLTESLIEMHKFMNFFVLSNETRTVSLTEEEINKRIIQINERPLKMPFPKLITDIEAILQSPLPYRDELISVNDVRNCLVHRNGIVMSKDINDIPNNCLKLIYHELVVLSEKEGKVIEVKKEDKEPGFVTNKIGFDIRVKSLSFNLGETVIIKPSVFNNISFMCIQFCQNILEISTNLVGVKLN